METKTKTKNYGKDFEYDFINSLDKDIYRKRLRDSVGLFGVKNECDFIIFYKNLFLLELKTTAAKSLSIQNIRPQQLLILTDLSYKDNIIAGFVINFRFCNETYFIGADKVSSYLLETGRKSIPYDFLQKNGYKIPQKLKRTRYSYDLTDFIKNFKKN